MSVNKAEQSLEDKLVQDIDGLKRDLRELKTRQLTGGDNMLVISGQLVTASATVTPGIDNVLRFFVTVTPTPPRLNLIDPSFSFAVGVDHYDNRYPNGASLASNQKLMRTSWWQDWWTSVDATGVRVYIWEVENFDVIPQTIYFKFRGYMMSQSGA